MSKKINIPFHLREQLHELARKKVEYWGLVDLTENKIIKLKRGNQYAVESSVYKPRKNLIGFHTHPSTARASFDDIIGIVTHGAPELLVNRKGVTLITPQNWTRCLRILHDQVVTQTEVVSWTTPKEKN